MPEITYACIHHPGVTMEELMTVIPRSIAYIGDYSGLHFAWRRMYEELQAQGVEPKGEPRECYETSPEEVSDPSEHRTLLVWPLD